MLKLYKQQDDKTLYWATWSNDQFITIQKGVLGDAGAMDTFIISKEVDALIAKETARLRAQGYTEIEPEKSVSLIIQYQIEGWGTDDDLDKRNEVMDLMDDCLGRTGLGHCDGGDMGSGTANIFCPVVDSYLARDVIVKCLAEHNLLSGATIAIEREESFEVLWPENYTGKFSY